MYQHACGLIYVRQSQQRQTLQGLKLPRLCFCAFINNPADSWEVSVAESRANRSHADNIKINLNLYFRQKAQKHRGLEPAWIKVKSEVPEIDTINLIWAASWFSGSTRWDVCKDKLQINWSSHQHNGVRWSRHFWWPDFGKHFVFRCRNKLVRTRQTANNAG